MKATKTRKLTGAQQAVLDYMERHVNQPTATSVLKEEIAEATGYAATTVEAALGDLVNLDKLVKPRTGHYMLVEGSQRGGDVGESPQKPERETQLAGTESSLQEVSTDVEELFGKRVTLTVYTDVRASAGGGYYNEHPAPHKEITVYREFITRLIGFMPPQKFGAVIAYGDSMSPTIEKNDLVLFEFTEVISDGGIYVLIVDNRTIIKRVQPISGGGYRLISDNTYHGYYNETLVPPEDDEHTDYNLVNKETGQPVELIVVGNVVWPRRQTDRMHVKQVTEIIRGLQGDGGEVPPQVSQ